MRSSTCIVSIQPNDERPSHDRSVEEATWAHKLKSYLGTSRKVVAKKVQQGPARFRVIVPLKPDNLISRHRFFLSFFIYTCMKGDVLYPGNAPGRIQIWVW